MRPPDTTNAYQYQEDTQKLMHPHWCTVAEDRWCSVAEDNWRTVGEDHWCIMPEDRWCIVARGVTQAILISSVLGILYTLIERTIREVQKRESKLKLTIAEMQIQINELKRQEDVAEISSSDFFQELQQKAAQLRGAPPKPAEE